jgi:hypothetical protein
MEKKVHKSRRLIKKQPRIPVVIYTNNSDPDSIKEIKMAWRGITSYPCLVAGPGILVSHPEMELFDYKMEKSNGN